jgi:hypothetical protein
MLTLFWRILNWECHRAVVSCATGTQKIKMWSHGDHETGVRLFNGVLSLACIQGWTVKYQHSTYLDYLRNQLSKVQQYRIEDK